MKASKLSALGLAIMALGACRTPTVPEKVEPPKKVEDPTVLSEAQTREYAEKLKAIDGIKAVVYTCDGSANIIAMYGLDKDEKVLAAKISVGNIVSPPILRQIKNGRNVFRFFDGKIEWSTTSKEGDELLLTKYGKLVLKGHKNLILNHCEVNSKLTKDFSKSMGDKLEEHAVVNSDKTAAPGDKAKAADAAKTGESGKAAAKSKGKSKAKSKAKSKTAAKSKSKTVGKKTKAKTK